MSVHIESHFSDCHSISCCWSYYWCINIWVWLIFGADTDTNIREYKILIHGPVYTSFWLIPQMSLLNTAQRCGTEAGYFIVYLLFCPKWPQSTETVNFTGDFVIINYPSIFFCIINPKKSVFVLARVGQQICRYWFICTISQTIYRLGSS